MCAQRIKLDEESDYLLKHLIAGDGVVPNKTPAVQPQTQIGAAFRFTPGDDREWLFLNLTAATKFKFLQLISAQSLATLRSITEAIDIKMPEDIKFSTLEVKVLKERWLMKACVLFSITLCCLQMYAFTIISHTITTYYDTSIDLVNWTSLVFMLCYFLFTFPVSYLLDNRIVVNC